MGRPIGQCRNANSLNFISPQLKCSGLKRLLFFNFSNHGNIKFMTKPTITDNTSQPLLLEQQLYNLLLLFLIVLLTPVICRACWWRRRRLNRMGHLWPLLGVALLSFSLCTTSHWEPLTLHCNGSDLYCVALLRLLLLCTKFWFDCTRSWCKACRCVKVIFIVLRQGYW